MSGEDFLNRAAAVGTIVSTLVLIAPPIIRKIRGSPHNKLDVPESARPREPHSTWPSSQAGTPKSSSPQQPTDASASPSPPEDPRRGGPIDSETSAGPPQETVLIGPIPGRPPPPIPPKGWRQPRLVRVVLGSPQPPSKPKQPYWSRDDAPIVNPLFALIGIFSFATTATATITDNWLLALVVGIIAGTSFLAWPRGTQPRWIRGIWVASTLTLCVIFFRSLSNSEGWSEFLDKLVKTLDN
jgi:hypothetical protein